MLTGTVRCNRVAKHVNKISNSALTGASEKEYIRHQFIIVHSCTGLCVIVQCTITCTICTISTTIYISHVLYVHFDQNVQLTWLFLYMFYA